MLSNNSIINIFQTQFTMKKSFLTVLLASVCSTGFTQITFHAKAGLNLSRYIGEGSERSEIKPGVRLGAGVEYKFNELISFQPSLMFSQKGTKVNLTNVESERLIYINNTVNQLYFEIPLNAQFRFKLTQNANLIVATGPYVAYGVGGKTKKETTIKPKYNEKSTSVTDKVDTFNKNGMNIRPFDTGWNIGVGAEVNQYIVSIESQIGLIKLQKESEMKNLNFALTFGYKF